MNRHLFDLLKRIEEGARRQSTGTQPIRELTLVHVELEDMTDALEAFKAEVAAGASVGETGGRLIKENDS